MLVDIEFSSRKSNRLKRLIHNAGFNQPEANIMDINYTSGRKLNKALISRLATCEYSTSSIISTCSPYHISEIIAPINISKHDFVQFARFVRIVLLCPGGLSYECKTKTSSGPSSIMGWSLCGAESQRADCPAAIWPYFTNRHLPFPLDERWLEQNTLFLYYGALP